MGGKGREKAVAWLGSVVRKTTTDRNKKGYPPHGRQPFSSIPFTRFRRF